MNKYSFKSFVALQSYVKALISPSVQTLSSVMDKINVDTYHYKIYNDNNVRKFEIFNVLNENKIINFDIIFLPAGKTIFEKIDRDSVVKPLFNDIMITHYNNDIEVPFELSTNKKHIFQNKTLYSLSSKNDNVLYKFSIQSLRNNNKYYNVRYGCGITSHSNGSTRNYSIYRTNKPIDDEDDDGYFF